MSTFYPLPTRQPIHSFFFFNDTATTEIYTLSLHDALPISSRPGPRGPPTRPASTTAAESPPSRPAHPSTDRKSTRLNSSHSQISYAVFCLKKKKNKSCIVSTAATLPSPLDSSRRSM